MKWKGKRLNREMKDTTDVANRVTVILAVIIDLTTTTTTIPSIHTPMAAIIPCIPITDIPIHIIRIMDITLIMGGIGIGLIGIATRSRSLGLVI